MPRRPEPWYWTAKRCWYVQVDRKQCRLDPDEKVARAMWHRLMADAGRLGDEVRKGLTIREGLDLFLDSRAGRRAATMEKYEDFLIPFALSAPNRRLADLKQSDVTRYCVSRRKKRAGDRYGWGDSTCWSVYGMVATFVRWARESGLIDFNPLAGTTPPWTAPQPRRAMTREEYDALMGEIRDHQLRLLLRVLWATGCRPGEAYGLRADQLHPLQPVATLEPGEHKTGGRTGKRRFIIFPPALMLDIREKALAYPDGPILRNTWGKPWTLFNVNKRFAGYRKALGLDGGCVPYTARHAFATSLATNNPDQSDMLLARVLGHSNPQTLRAVYYHPEMTKMIELVGREDGSGRPIEVAGV